jgi:nucleoside 2-deoxyribosyltransferase
MAAPPTICPLCDLPADVNVGYMDRLRDSGYGGFCKRCGNIHITESAITKFKQANKLYLLSAYFRNRRSEKIGIITTHNADAALSSMPTPETFREKMDLLLQTLGKGDSAPGEYIKFDPADNYPVAYAKNTIEAAFILEELIARGFIHKLDVRGTFDYRVTANGFERIEQLEQTSFRNSSTAFVAMWFDNSRDFVFDEAIEPAIREAGYKALRIDKTDHVNKIDDEIIALLRQSRFLVADFTGQRGGVYYEAGFMHGLGRRVYWLVEEGELPNVHFDLRQYNFIGYTSTAHAKKRLLDRILANEESGPLALTRPKP